MSTFYDVSSFKIPALEMLSLWYDPPKVFIGQVLACVTQHQDAYEFTLPFQQPVRLLGTVVIIPERSSIQGERRSSILASPATWEVRFVNLRQLGEI